MRDRASDNLWKRHFRPRSTRVRARRDALSWASLARSIPYTYLRTGEINKPCPGKHGFRRAGRCQTPSVGERARKGETEGLARPSHAIQLLDNANSIIASSPSPPPPDSAISDLVLPMKRLCYIFIAARLFLRAIVMHLTDISSV